MSTRLHFFIFVLVFLTILSFNGVAPQTQELKKGHRVSTNGAINRMTEQSGSNPRILQQSNQDEPENPKPRVMGHGEFRDWRSQPSGVGEEEGIDGREFILSKKIKLKPKRGYTPNKGLSPVHPPKA
ncbi:hypothetical protein R6Q59_025165 [Mikania micrantha]